MHGFPMLTVTLPPRLPAYWLLGDEGNDLCDDTHGSYGIWYRSSLLNRILGKLDAWLVVIAIICAAFLALSQREIKECWPISLSRRSATWWAGLDL